MLQVVLETKLFIVFFELSRNKEIDLNIKDYVWFIPHPIIEKTRNL